MAFRGLLRKLLRALCATNSFRGAFGLVREARDAGVVRPRPPAT